MADEVKPDAADQAADVRGDEFFEFGTQVNAANMKRTYDSYQNLEFETIRANSRLQEKLDNVAVQALQNAVETANMVGKQAVKHADVAADALWTDELNPVVRGAGDVMAGQAPVNSQVASTTSLDTAFMNLTAQNGELVTAVIGLANSVAAQNAAVTAALAQLVENMKQTAPTKTA